MLDRAGLERMNITPDGGGCAFRMSSVEGWEDDRGEREGGREGANPCERYLRGASDGLSRG